MALRLKFGSHSQQPIPNFTKSDIPEMLKDTKEIPIRQLSLSVFNSRKLGRNPEQVDISCYYIICFNSFGVRIDSWYLSIQEI